MILVFEELLQTSIPPLISLLYAKGYHDFPLKIFRLTVPKKFVRESYCFEITSGFERFYGCKGRYHVFRSKIFGLTAEKFRGRPFNVSEFLGYRKILYILRVSQFSVEVFFVSVPKNFVKEPISVSLISGIKKS